MASESGSAATPWFELLFKDQYNALAEFLKDGYAYSGMDPHTLEHTAQVGASVVFSSWLVCGTLIVLALLAKNSLSSVMKETGHKKFYGRTKFSIGTLFEVYVQFMRNLGTSILGKAGTNDFFWIFGGLFLYILFNNLMGLLPGAVSPSTSLSNNFAMGLFVTVAFTVIGLKRQGTYFIKHLAGPVWWLAPLIFLIEFLGTFIIRPVSLSLRLTGNMNGDHLVLGVAYSLFEWVLPVFALGLGTFVSLVQAFVFTILSIIYVMFSLEHDDHDH